MASLIEHANYIDVSELAELVREQKDVIEAGAGNDYTEEDIEDARDTLKDVSSLLSDIGYRGLIEADEISDALHTIGQRSNGTLVADDYFEESIEQYYNDVYGETVGFLPDGLVIDWEATADGAKTDYSSGTLNGETYWIRRG